MACAEQNSQLPKIRLRTFQDSRCQTECSADKDAVSYVCTKKKKKKACNNNKQKNLFKL